jgi:hypothetical protein
MRCARFCAVSKSIARRSNGWGGAGNSGFVQLALPAAALARVPVTERDTAASAAVRRMTSRCVRRAPLLAAGLSASRESLDAFVCFVVFEFNCIQI